MIDTCGYGDSLIETHRVHKQITNKHNRCQTNQWWLCNSSMYNKNNNKVKLFELKTKYDCSTTTTMSKLQRVINRFYGPRTEENRQKIYLLAGVKNCGDKNIPLFITIGI